MLVPILIIIAVSAAAVFGYALGWREAYSPVPTGTIVICRSGWKTPNPQVHVSACSRWGAQTVYSWSADSVGEVKASMYGNGLAEILGLPLRDERSPENAPDAVSRESDRNSYDDKLAHVQRDDEIYGRNG